VRLAFERGIVVRLLRKVKRKKESFSSACAEEKGDCPDATPRRIKRYRSKIAYEKIKFGVKSELSRCQRLSKRIFCGQIFGFESLRLRVCSYVYKV
jgi:hypothetical protein